MAFIAQSSRIITFLVLAIGVLGSGHASNAQPSTGSISFQAKLDGVTMPTVDLTFQFWDDATSLDPVHHAGGEILVPNVPVAGGVVSTAVPVAAATFNGQDRWLSVSVNGASPLMPRTLITSVPYAMAAKSIIGNRVEEAFTSGDKFIATAGWYEGPQDFAFIGGRQRGQLNNWYLDRAPNWYPLIGTGAPEGGFGMAHNVDEASPVIWMERRVGRSRFAVRATDLYHDARDGTDLFVVQENGNVGIRTNAPEATLDVRGNARVGGEFSCGRLTIPELFVVQANGNVGIRTNAPEATLDVRGNARVGGELSCAVLTIRGGGDLAEQTGVTPTATPTQPGMVMIIDREHDGKLLPCSAAYDTAVAGVISGANGLAAGLVLRPQGDAVVDGDYPLAMTGKVWVMCDASLAPIHRGDRLTTSATPGHAMAATDNAKCPGAVIGKAMTELTEGKGLVLVLVNLQ